MPPPHAAITTLAAILPLRALYRQEMACQIIHDSLHTREGWTRSYFLSLDAATAGYGSIAIGGPWTDKPAIFEFYVLPEHRCRAFDLFRALLTASAAAIIETQTNAPLLTIMLHTFATGIASESILFDDMLTTTHAIPGAALRPVTPEDAAALKQQDLDPDCEFLLTLDGAIAAAGGMLTHYNPPYADIYMKVAEPLRRRGLGAFLVQELKRVSYDRALIPAARCRTANIPSRRTLQRAGFVPCAHLLTGVVSHRPPAAGAG